MPQEWFVRKGEIERGPLSSQELKRLVVTKALSASDMVRTADKPIWRAAGTVQGLFPKDPSENPVPTPPPPIAPFEPTVGRPPQISKRVWIGVAFVALIVFAWLRPKSEVRAPIGGPLTPSNIVDRPGAASTKKSNITAPQVDLKPFHETQQRERQKEAVELAVQEERAKTKQRADEAFATQRDRAKAVIAQKEQDDAQRHQQEEGKHRKVVEVYFSGLSFDPQSVTMTKSLRNAGATVEIIGKQYGELRRLHHNKDWLGLINLRLAQANVHHRNRTDYFDADALFDNWRSQRFCRDGLNMLVKTKQKYKTNTLLLSDKDYSLLEIFRIQFPLRADLTRNPADLKFDSPLTVSPNIQKQLGFESHPDNSGYFAEWSPDLMYIVGVEKDLNDSEFSRDYVNALNQEMREATTKLQIRLRLGEVDDNAAKMQTTAEVVRLYQKTKAWADKR